MTRPGRRAADVSEGFLVDGDLPEPEFTHRFG